MHLDINHLNFIIFSSLFIPVYVVCMMYLLSNVFHTLWQIVFSKKGAHCFSFHMFLHFYLNISFKERLGVCPLSLNLDGLVTIVT